MPAISSTCAWAHRVSTSSAASSGFGASVQEFKTFVICALCGYGSVLARTLPCIASGASENRSTQNCWGVHMHICMLNMASALLKPSGSKNIARCLEREKPSASHKVQ